ncbi:hypothetical protein FI667_g14557, partial [Globisporangium splendens]
MVLRGDLHAAPTTISYCVATPPAMSSYDQHGTNNNENEERLVKKPRKKRSGWGPYQSVLKERSVDFNLTLDVQNLQQEVKNMEMLRSILLNKTLIQRHDPNGSLVQKAKNHYTVMRSGFNLRETGRKRVLSEQDQKEWIKSIFDENVDVGNGACGVDTLIEQIKLYTVFINFISNTMTSFEVVATDDTVLVATQGILHFQITRTTIASMFPHIMSEEWLVAKLVGQEIHAESAMNFYFSSTDKVTKFEVILDYVKTFIDILKDPREVDLLLGRALITSNSMVGLTDEDLPQAPSRSPPKDVTSSESDDSGSTWDDSSSQNGGNDNPGGSSSYDDPQSEDENSASRDVRVHAEKTRRAEATDSNAISTPTGPLTPTSHFDRVVKDYFHLFASGSESATSVSVRQRAFLNQHFSPSVGYGSAVGRDVVEDRWRSLCWCFGALSFRQLSQEPPTSTPIDDNLFLVQATAEYTMHVTVRTVEQVFPHVLTDLTLMDSIVSSTIRVDAQLTFWLEKDSGRVASITEQMDFDTALAQIVPHPEDRAFVVSRALPTLFGFVGEVVEAEEPNVVENDKEASVVNDGGSSPLSPGGVASSPNAKMSLSNILG